MSANLELYLGLVAGVLIAMGAALLLDSTWSPASVPRYAKRAVRAVRSYEPRRRLRRKLAMVEGDLVAAHERIQGLQQAGIRLGASYATVHEKLLLRVQDIETLKAELDRVNEALRLCRGAHSHTQQEARDAGLLFALAVAQLPGRRLEVTRRELTDPPKGSMVRMDDPTSDLTVYTIADSLLAEPDSLPGG